MLRGGLVGSQESDADRLFPTRKESSRVGFQASGHPPAEVAMISP